MKPARIRTEDGPHMALVEESDGAGGAASSPISLHDADVVRTKGTGIGSRGNVCHALTIPAGAS